MPLPAITIEFALPTQFLDERGQRAGFVLLAAFLVSFLFIRTSSRLIRSPRVPWWPGSVKTSGGLHLHHLVWGIVLVLTTGFLEFALAPTSPWDDVLAAGFGVGTGLTLDEFALWIHLRDVYWAEEGRASLDAVVVATALGGLVVLGLAPFDLSKGASSVTTLVASVLLTTVLGMCAILKGRPFLGLIGVFVPLASVVGVCRLAAPSSPWARRFYDAGGRKLATSKARFERSKARKRRLADAIAGSPSAPSADRGD